MYIVEENVVYFQVLCLELGQVLIIINNVIFKELRLVYLFFKIRDSYIFDIYMRFSYVL